MAEWISESEADRRIRSEANRIADERIAKMADYADGQWHLDKKVPVSIIVAIILQTLGFVAIGAAWKADVDSRLTQLERSDADRKPQESRLIRLEEKLLGIANSLARIENRLEARVNNGSDRQ